MRDKLEKIIKAYEELEKKLSDPAVASDIKEFTRLNKEYAHQSDLIAASREYIARSMTSRLPRKCSTILPMPMRRRCSRWTSPKTRPNFPSSRKTLSTCSSRATPTTTRTPSSRFAPPPVATRRPSSPATCTRCISAFASRVAGRPPCSIPAPARPAALSPSSSRSRATASTPS